MLLAFNGVMRLDQLAYGPPAVGLELGYWMTRPKLSVVEVAAIAAVRPATVRRWCQNGRLPAERSGGRWVIRPADLRRFLSWAGQASASERDVLSEAEGQTFGSVPADAQG